MKTIPLCNGLSLVSKNGQFTLFTDSVTWYGAGKLSITKEQADCLLKAFVPTKPPTLYGMFFPNQNF